MERRTGVRREMQNQRGGCRDSEVGVETDRVSIVESSIVESSTAESVISLSEGDFFSIFCVNIFLAGYYYGNNQNAL